MKLDPVFKVTFIGSGIIVFLLFLALISSRIVLPGNFYVIEITDLPGVNVNGTAVVMVPIPANTEGEPVIPEGVFSSAKTTGWEIAIQETLYGKMLAFTATDDCPPDISASFEMLQVENGSRRLPLHLRPTNLTAWEMKREPRLLMPVLATPGGMSFDELVLSSSETYTTVVFLDGFVSSPEDAVPITLILEYRGVGGTERLLRENTWTTMVNVTVSNTASGFIQVPAEHWVVAGGIEFG